MTTAEKIEKALKDYFKIVLDAKFKESDHPRGKNGQFSSVGGGGSPGEKPAKKKSGWQKYKEKGGRLGKERWEQVVASKKENKKMNPEREWKKYKSGGGRLEKKQWIQIVASKKKD